MTGAVVSDFTKVRISRDQRYQYLNQQGATLWFTGLSAAGKSTIGFHVERLLLERGYLAYVLDGDELRTGLNKDLTFSHENREENIRRVSEVAKVLSDVGVFVICCLISPYHRDRQNARAIHEKAGLPFLEVFIDTPLEVCEARDPKGLYAKARGGEIQHFTGLDDPYERPEAPELVIETTGNDPVDAALAVIEELKRRELLRRC